jgi:hypothetical protein
MDPLAAFGHGLVGQPDDGEARKARRKLHLHLDGAGLEAEIRHGGYGRAHLERPPGRNTK